MDFRKAFEILEIDTNKVSYHDITYDYLKKRYHKLALQYHPDKNSNIESKEKFQKIDEAYRFLKEEIEIIHKKDHSFSQETFSGSNENEYIYFLSMFLQGILQGHSSKIIDMITNIIKKIVVGCQKVTIHWFEDLDKETCIQIYEFLSTYRNILYIDEDVLSKVREIILEKCKNDHVYILNPSIDDLLYQNVYKLTIDDEIYFVPLWHINSDIIYDKVNKSNDKIDDDLDNKTNDKQNNDPDDKPTDEKREKEEIIVRCIPELPENIWIDEEENIHFLKTVHTAEFSLYDNKTIPINVGKKRFEIPVQDLFIQRKQNYVFYGEGISRIRNNLNEELNEINLEKRISNTYLNKKNIIVHIEII